MRKLNLYLALAEDFFQALTTPNRNLKLFRQATYALLFLKISWAWSALPLFYNASAVVDYSNLMNWPTQLILLPFFEDQQVVLHLVMLSIIGTAIVVKSRILAILVFLISVNYNNLFALAINGGDTILGFFIFLLVFTSEKKEKTTENRMMTNAAWLMLKLHLCCIYFINGYGKIVKKIWLNGDAMYATWNLEYFSNPHLVPNWFLNPAVCFLTAWSVMIFELSFPFLIWYRTPRKYLIPIGILFHLFIALFLSLPDFGLTMIIAYLLFADLDKLNVNFTKKAGQIHEPLS